MTAKLETSNTLGKSVLDAVGIDPGLVTNVKIECAAGHPAQLTITTCVTEDQAKNIVATLRKYKIVEEA